MATVGKDIRSLMRSRTVFGKLSAKDLDAHRNALKYIELIAMQANIPIANWDIKQVFRQGASKKLITDPKEINKRLFAMHSNTKEQEKKLALLDVYENAEALKSFQIHRDEYHMNNLKNDLVNYEKALADSTVANNLNQIKFCTKRIKEYKRALKTYETKYNFYEDVIRLMNDGFWRLFKVDTDSREILFVTANNIVLFDKNPKTKINIHKDMGQYLVAVTIQQGYLSVNAETFKGNTLLGDDESDGLIHPYISGGRFCLGNATTAFNKAAAKKNLYQAMTIIGSALTTYNSGNGPYVTLYQFTAKSSSSGDLYPIKDTPASKEYEARKKKQLETLDERLKELAGVVPVIKTTKRTAKSITKVKNRLAKSMGRSPVRLENVSHDEDNDDDLADQLYEQEQEENDDEGYF